MTGGTDWVDGNTRYMAAALAWLRACLDRPASDRQEQSPQTLLVTPSATEEPKSRWKNILGRPGAVVGKAPILLPAAGNEVEANHLIAQAAQALDAAAAIDPPPALVILAQRLGLSKFEQDVLILGVGMELDTGIASLCARGQGDDRRPFPTFALAFSLFENASWDALSPERPLRYWRLLEITQSPGQPLISSALHVDERIVGYCKGLSYLDDRLLSLLSPMDVTAAPADLPASHREVVESILQRLKLAEASRSLPIVQLLGTDAATKRLVAGEVAASIGLQMYLLPAPLLPTQPTDIEALARLWQRESLLLPLALYVDASTQTAEVTAPNTTALAHFLERLEGAVFLDVLDAAPALRRATLAVDIVKPTPVEQSAAWKSALGAAASDAPDQLAGQFNLSFSVISRLAREAQIDAPADPPTLRDRLWDACLTSTRPQMDTLARRIVATATWADLILPAAECALLRQIAAQVAQRSTVYEKWGFSQKVSRGLGMSVLFSGESGTGKTLAAEVLSHELRINLYRIDLSAVVSKYIGETEKNLRRLFDAAEDGGAILFFDEADALFGSRSEVKDSHDRYANIEINYLLQRIESYRGLAILATNMKSALDNAFLRRLRFVVRFPFPGVAERKAMWQRAFPADTPTAALDYQRLARLNITGGNIHNVALNAAFTAASAASPVTMPIVLDAAKTELRKIERPINDADFRWEPSAGAVA